MSNSIFIGQNYIFATMHSCTMNSSIIVVQPDIGFENVQIFAFATMFKFADIFENFDFDFLFMTKFYPRIVRLRYQMRYYYNYIWKEQKGDNSRTYSNCPTD
ncbi:hypothetical protein LCGC14_2906190 [marine sediment metagenome]|uniref:Uncharacterized protein n=1 Tax=marine sediment metagenome TaxID=412755 RepID=A0A0F8YEQ9_9ZZZZ